eukprot:m.296674 g.296674  ORF g.296674 m.296674 type:complete len:59 (+) comp72123_c0_seq1:93-269(+)
MTPHLRGKKQIDTNFDPDFVGKPSCRAQPLPAQGKGSQVLGLRGLIKGVRRGSSWTRC